MASLVLGRYGVGRAGISRDETMDEIRKAVQHTVERARRAPLTVCAFSNRVLCETALRSLDAQHNQAEVVG